jgi:hypothetical protein
MVVGSSDSDNVTLYVAASVPDPNPDPPDPHVFGPSGYD